MLSSLRLRILVITLVVIALALIINASVSYTILKTQNDEQVAQQLASISHGNALAIEEWVASRTAMMEAAQAPVSGSDPVQPLIQLAESGGFLSTYLARPDGSLLTSDGWVPGDDYDPRTRDWYKTAVAQDKTVVSLPYLDANSGRLVVPFSTPIKRNGQLYGVIGGDVEIDNLIAQVNAIKPTPSSFAFLSSGGETVIAHPDSALTLKPLPQLSEALTPASIDRLRATQNAWEPVEVGGDTKRIAATPIAGTTWELGVALDEYEATAGLRACGPSSTQRC